MTPSDRQPNRVAVLRVLGLALVLLGPAPAQTPPLVADRPDQTESSQTVPPGYAQFELGWTYRKEDDNAKTTSHAFPETLVRLGIVERLELRIGFDGYIWADPEDAGRFEGAGDMEIGLKWKLWEEFERRPQTALLVGTSAPTGEAPFSSRRFDPSLRLAFSHTLNETFSLDYNVAGLWRTEQNARGNRDTTASIAYSAVLGIDLTDTLGTFVEFFGETPTDSGRPAHALDTGLTYLIADNVQFDVIGGIGLSDEADDWFVGAGVTWRLPH
jgi:hypothetical protein